MISRVYTHSSYRYWQYRPQLANRTVDLVKKLLNIMLNYEYCREHDRNAVY